MPVQSALSQPGTSADAVAFEGRVKPPPADVETTISLKSNEDPESVSSKVSSASIPSPAGRVAPLKSIPSTMPVALLNCVSPRPEVAPVNETPDAVNWNPATSKLDV